MTTLKDMLKKKQPEEAQQGHKMRFFVLSEYGELLDLAIHLSKVEKHEVVFCVPNPDYKKIGEGILKKADDWFEYLGKDYIFVVDGCERAKLQDWLRSQGEFVVGTNETMSEHEEDRQKGQDLFKKAGFTQPESNNFKEIDKAIEFIQKNTDRKWILKQNGNAPKHLNHKGKFDNNEDMLFHLEEMKKSWSENEFGKFDVDLMEIVEGLEVAASAFFNGHDFLRNEKGKVVGYLNYEEKKQSDGGLGVTCGEMGTLFKGVDQNDKLFADIILNKELIKVLEESDYRGVFDVNCIVSKEGIVALEPTSRFGIPATSYEFMEGLDGTTAGELLEAMACGLDTPIEVNRDWGIAQVIVAPPFPVEADVEEQATSMGEKLWIMQNKKPIDDFTKDQRVHIHLENFYKTEDGDYKVATKNGYLLVITAVGKTIAEARENSLQYIKENIYISDMTYRQDLGKRVEEEL